MALMDHHTLVTFTGTEIQKTKVRCKKENGKGEIELKEDGMILTIDDKTHKCSFPNHKTDTVKPFFDIRFGNLAFSVPGLPYVSSHQQTCVSQISQEEMVLDYHRQTHSRPTDEEFHQGEIIKSPRLDSQQMSPKGDHQTCVKQIYTDDNEIGKNKLDNFHEMLDLAKQMQEKCRFSHDYFLMFNSMEVSLEENLRNLENNVFVPPFQMEQAKQKLKDAFQR
ncbi:hypothetical protein LOTGIDRAFT_174268 [Lottia gigantea]|uniref:Uncharacterized protein n=1 Tax=Lottia gigantea TaxID=225164 RepID=V4C9N1_LOTGI|nr:hypothetical protein LOTGIDRAFT_174268 [Lottia gigantea]ESO98459.1 hypothetical protein LOTGIDRAFT_174268 [Lottia gigantea]